MGNFCSSAEECKTMFNLIETQAECKTKFNLIEGTPQSGGTGATSGDGIPVCPSNMSLRKGSCNSGATASNCEQGYIPINDSPGVNIAYKCKWNLAATRGAFGQGGLKDACDDWKRIQPGIPDPDHPIELCRFTPQ